MCMVAEPDFTHTFKKLAKHAAETNTCSDSTMEYFLITTYNRLLYGRLCFLWDKLGYKITKPLRRTP